MKPFRYSTISLFHKCPKYYELNQILGIPDDAEQSADMAFGTAIHAAMQAEFEDGNPIDAFRYQWDEVKLKTEMNYTRYRWEDLNTIGRELIARFQDYKKHFIPAHLEQKLIAPLGQHLISGTVDFIGEYRGVPSVVDWKTSAMPYDAYKIRCNEQMYGYDYLAKEALGFEAKQLVYGVAIKDLKNPRWQFRTAPLTDLSRKKVLDNLGQLCDTIAGAKSFHRNPQSCVIGKRVCPYFEYCHGETVEQVGVREGLAATGELSLAANERSNGESEGI